MTLRHILSVTLLATAMATTALLPAARAELETLSATDSLAATASDALAATTTTPTTTTTDIDGDGITADTDPATLKTYAEMQAYLVELKARYIVMSDKIEAGDTTYNTAQLNLLQQKIADTKVSADILYEKELDAATNSGSSGSSGSTGSNGSLSNGGYSDNYDNGGSGSSGGAGGIADSIKQAVTQQLMQGMLGNSGNLGNNLLGGLTGNMGQMQGQALATGAQQLAANAIPQANKVQEKALGKAPACKEKKDTSTAAPKKSTTDTLPGKAKDDYIGGSGGGTTDTEPGKAKDDIIASNGNTTDTLPGKTADDQLAKDEDPCIKPDYLHKNPITVGTDVAGSMTSAGDAEKYVGQFVGKNQQCASLVKALAPGVGAASTWQQGEQVMGNTSLKPGTPIATFNYGGNYGPSSSPGGVSGGSHSAIYLGQNSQGVMVLNQWSGQPATKTLIPWNSWGGKTAEAGSKYYVIQGGNSFLEMIPILQPVWMAIKLLPFEMGLLKA